MNRGSLARTLPGERDIRQATLSGYQRKMNIPVQGYLYLNIVPNEQSTIEGVLIEVTDEEFVKVCEREVGYEPVDVSGRVTPLVDAPAVVFVAPDGAYPNLLVPRSYIETCLRGVPMEKRESWVAETIIENEIIEDLDAPVYANVFL